jgi:hypothetical protein
LFSGKIRKLTVIIRRGRKLVEERKKRKDRNEKGK